MVINVGKIAGQYAVLRTIGEGGFATVYKAADLTLQRFVAVKKIKEEYISNADVSEMFRKEAVNTAKLEHENIVKVINFVKDEENHYIILDYVNGVDLEYFLKKLSEEKVSMPPGLAAYIVYETLKALDYAHNYRDDLTGKPMSFIHHDVSPGNIMLYYDGRVKLTDFGIAKARGAAAKKGIRGKIAYLSPEQAAGKEAGTVSDLFSLGLVFYEALAGKRAYRGNMSQKIWQAKKAKVDLKSLKKGKVPEPVFEILKSLLQKKTKKRYESASKCLEDIEKYLLSVKEIKEWERDYRVFVQEKLEEEILASEKETKEEDKFGFDLQGEATPEFSEEAADVPPAEKEEKEVFWEPEEEEVKEPEPVKDDEGQELPDDAADVSPAEKEEKEVFREPEEEEEKEPEPVKKAKKEKKKKKPVDLSGEKEKTVIDFILDTAKKHKKIFISLMVSVLSAFVIFSAVDTYLRMTPVGIRIYNKFWPPALSIDTYPSGARIRIIDENDVDIVSKYDYRRITPTYIERIPPGTYQLRLSKEEYGEMTRIITVLEQETGEQQITVGGSVMERQVHIVPFEVLVSVDSVPPGALLMVNGRNVGRTPFSGNIEIDRHNLQLVREGFEPLGMQQMPQQMQPGVCVLDTSQRLDEQYMIDRRFWNVSEETLPDRRKKFNVTGFLWKYISVKSDPPGALAFLTDLDSGETEELGTTPLSDIMLTVGEYKLDLQRPGYKDWEGEFTLDENTEDIKTVEMKKYVTVNALQSGTGRRVNANISVSHPAIGTVRGATPFRVALPPGNARFSLSNEPTYIPVNVTRDVRRLGETFNVEMSLRPPHLTVEVNQFTTGAPIGEATVWVNDMYWKRTGNTGRVSGFLDDDPGMFDIEVRSEDYGQYRTRLNVNRGQRRRVEVRLGAPRDGSVFLDIPDRYTVESITIGDDRFGVPPDNVIREIPRGPAYLEIKLKEFDEALSASLNFASANEIYAVKLVEDRREPVLSVENLPSLNVTVRDYETQDPVSGAQVRLGAELLGRTGEDGVYSSTLLKSEGKYILTIEKEGVGEIRTAAQLENNRTDSVVVETNAPVDGTLIIDVGDGIYDAAVYVGGNFRGENPRLIPAIPRGRSIVEVRSDILGYTVTRIIEISSRRTLAVLRLRLTETGLVVEEVDQREFLR